MNDVALRNQLRKQHFYVSSSATPEAFLQAEKGHASEYPLKGELIKSSREKPKIYNFVSDATFETVHLHLVLPSYLNRDELSNFNQCHVLFEHLHKMMSMIKLQYAYDLFTYDESYASQESIPSMSILQCLFLALLHRLNPYSAAHSLKCNKTSLRIDPKKIISQWKAALEPELLQQLENVLLNNNSGNFYVHVTKEQ